MVKFRIDRQTLNVVLIVALVLLGIIARNFPFTDGQLNMGMPPMSLTSDTGWHTRYAKWVADSGEALYWPAFVLANVEGGISPQPPLFYVFVGSFSAITSSSAYDMAFFIVGFFTVLVPLLVFVVVRRLFDERAALVALGLSIIPPMNWLFNFYFGFWLDLYPWALIPAVFFFLVYSYGNKSMLPPVLIGLMLGVQFMAHVPEFSYTIAFVIALTALFLVLKRIPVSYGLKMAVILVTFVLVILYYYPLAKVTYLGNEDILKNLGHPQKIPDYFPPVGINMYLLAFALLGAGITLKKLFISRDMGQLSFVLFALFMLAVGYSYLVGMLPDRAVRQMYPAYAIFMFFPAVGISFVLSKFFKNHFIWLLAALVIAVASFGATYGQMERASQYQLFDREKWDGLAWIRDNTPKDSLVLPLFSFGQSIGYYSERYPVQAELELGFTQETLKKMCAGEYPSEFTGILGGQTPYLERLGYMAKVERVGWDEFRSYPVNIIKMNGTWKKGLSGGGENVVFQLGSVDYVLVQYNRTTFAPCIVSFLNQAVGKGHTIAYLNGEIAVLKVNKNADA